MPVLLIQAFASLALTGLIWCIQVVHYPLFAAVGRDEFTRYEADHARLITLVVGPLMLVELAAALWLAAVRPAGVPAWMVWTGLALVAATWISTAAIQVPCLARRERESRQAENRLRESEANLRLAQRVGRVGSWHYDLTRNTLEWSEELYRIFGLDPARFHPAVETSPHFAHPDDRERVLAERARALAQGGEFLIDYRVVLPDGSERIVSSRALVQRDAEGRPLAMIGTVHDITDRKALERQLRHRAFHDPLTELPNRQLFVDRLAQALRRISRRRDREVAVLFIDLDNFKVINDSLGHRSDRGRRVRRAAGGLGGRSGAGRVGGPDGG